MVRQNQKLILASASPRRQELLAQVGLQFEVVSADVDESALPGEAPVDYVLRLATAKANVIAKKMPDAIVIGADTTVVIDNFIFGKPVDRADATRMIKTLAGKKHRVLTGVALASQAQGLITRHCTITELAFARLTPAQVEAYVSSGESDDKAGAYAVQGRAAGFITRIDGSYSNVIGLPLYETLDMLRVAGVIDSWP